MKAIPRKQRAMVRKGMRHGLRSEIDDGVDRLYRIYAESVHNLGTPVFAKSYFRILKEEFSTSSDIVTVSSGGKAVASVLNFYFRDEVLPFYGAVIAAARHLAANDFMYWEVMRRACERGYRIFDFGRSKSRHRVLRVQMQLGISARRRSSTNSAWRAGAPVPDLNPLNPKLAVFIAAWKRLPLLVATRLGPLIVRGIG